jgi:hypothetical protein
MLLVAERLTDGEIITIFVLCFDVSSNTLYIFLTLKVCDVQRVNRLDSSATSERIFIQEFGW